MAGCLAWAEERIESCTDWRDDGESSCTAWQEDCCDWWPCSWGCELVSWICTASVWIASWVCVGWTVVTTAVCVMWDAFFTVVNLLVVTVESLFGWILSAIAAIIAVILTIPIIGAILRWIITLVMTVAQLFVSLIDAFLGLIGIRPEKIMRVCPVILADENARPVDTIEHAIDQLQVAADFLKRECNIRLVPSQPFKYSTGFAGAPTVTADWIKILDREPGDVDTLEPSCDAAGFAADLGVAGSKFNLLMTVHCFYGAWRRLVAYGAPISVFFVRSISGGVGCGLWIVDFVTVAAQPMPTPQDLRRIATHEIGHASNLWHLDAASNGDNLMATPRPPVTNVMDYRLTDWQVLLVRASKHASYM